MDKRIATLKQSEIEKDNLNLIKEITDEETDDKYTESKVTEKDKSNINLKEMICNLVDGKISLDDVLEHISKSKEKV